MWAGIRGAKRERQVADRLKFGTSGLRGLAEDLLGPAAGRYTLAFIAYLRSRGSLAPEAPVLVGRDLRASSPAIAGAVMGAVRHAGLVPLDCGALPTPALALYGQTIGAPGIMVTGSHIPADRNGLKFYLASGEISKADEAGIIEALQGIEGVSSSDESGVLTPQAEALYRSRALKILPARALAGMKIGVFQQSSVARDLLVDVLGALGAEVTALGRETGFVAIDTEALGHHEIERAKGWVRAFGLDALVSTDGDADRPLIADNRGQFIRGDTLGILTARYLGADTVVTPVTSNSAIEGTGYFRQVVRTRVGSPYVIGAMAEAVAAGGRGVVGFEANGGVLLGSSFTTPGGRLGALATRDAVVPMLCTLGAARAVGLALTELVAALPARVARSDRLEAVPQARSGAFLDRFGDAAFAASYFQEVGRISDVSRLDGWRFTFETGDIVHYRASGNAPELRCYSEAATSERADFLLAWGLATAVNRVRD